MLGAIQPPIDWYDVHLATPETEDEEVIKQFIVTARSAVETTFPHYRVIELRTENMCRIEFRILDHNLNQSFKTMIAEFEGMLRPGPPTQDPLERVVNRMLAEVSKK